MRSVSIFIALVGLALSAPTAMAESEARFSLASMEPTDVLEISFESRGCFHTNAANFRFRKSSVSIDDGAWIDLSPKESVQFDRYMLYIQQLEGPGGCTTTDTLHVKLLRGDQTLRMDTFSDATCAESIRFMKEREGIDMPILLSPNNLLYREQRRTNETP
jgi:hypothetical protein